MTPEPATYPGHRFPAEIISHAIWLYHVFSLSLRDVELILAEGAVAKAVGNRVRRLRRDDGTASGGEINAALGRRLAEGLPAIDLTHADLT